MPDAPRPQDLRTSITLSPERVQLFDELLEALKDRGIVSLGTTRNELILRLAEERGRALLGDESQRPVTGQQAHNRVSVDTVTGVTMKQPQQPQPPPSEGERVTLTLPKELVQRLDQETGLRRAARRPRPAGRPGPYTRADLVVEALDAILPPLKG